MSDAKLIGVQRLTGQHAVAHADPFVVFTDPQNESDVVVATIARMDRLEHSIRSLTLGVGAVAFRSGGVTTFVSGEPAIYCSAEEYSCAYDEGVCEASTHFKPPADAVYPARVVVLPTSGYDGMLRYLKGGVSNTACPSSGRVY
jgi:hypothetical protein